MSIVFDAKNLNEREKRLIKLLKSQNNSFILAIQQMDTADGYHRRPAKKARRTIMKTYDRKSLVLFLYDMQATDQIYLKILGQNYIIDNRFGLTIIMLLTKKGGRLCVLRKYLAEVKSAND